jgi:hydrogenase-4 transcriptional activator
MSLELAAWKTVGRHIDIEDALFELAPELGRRLSCGIVVLRRLDLTRRHLDTVAVSVCDHESEPPAHGRTPLEPEHVSALLTFCRKGDLVRGMGEGKDPILRLLVPPGLGGELLAGPLSGEDGPIGAVVMSARRGGPFGSHVDKELRSLLEPLGALLDNSLRLQELKRLREAVEADKRALLDRLQRQDITESVVGSETGLKGVIERVDQVAPTDAPVLILGETGSGKEVIARTIHGKSRRAEGPMVRVNCGAIPPELIDSELFGHERGSFTGAVASRKGWFERADGGTLFLDEVSELPPAAQVRLLRVLQEGTLLRVGGQRTIAVDVRIVTATHRDLRAMVEGGAFREDLWYRISVFPVRLPPLRERTSDIPALAAHFAWRAGKRLGGVPLVPSADDVENLVSYPWPGNVRELAAVIERAAILGDGKRLEVAAALGVSARAPAGEPLAGDARACAQAALPTLDQAMARHVEAALRETRGRIEGPHGAAARLGVNPHTLRARMRKLRIDWASFRRPRDL